MLSLPFFNRRFAPAWWSTILALLMVAFFLRLGFWQLERAEEKKRMLTSEASLAKQATIAWNSGMKSPKQYQRISLEGHYLSPALLLDNQHYQHQFGYHVLSPFVLNNNEVVLIDRGWIAGGIARQVLPQVYSPVKLLRIEGSAYYASAKNWLLGQAIEKKESGTAIIEQVDAKLIGHFLHKSVYPFIIRLDKKEKYGFVRDWPIVAMLPERHYAYAIQWFAMALVVLILFFVLNLTSVLNEII